MAATSLSIHHIKDISFKQETLCMPDDSLLRLMRVFATDKKGDVVEITLFLTEHCQIEEVLT
jgi:hypothetical protein